MPLMQSGKWADHMCEKTFGYMCKKKASTKLAEGTQEETNPGCKLVSDVFSFQYECNYKNKAFVRFIITVSLFCFCFFLGIHKVRFILL